MRNYIWTSLKDGDDGSTSKGEGSEYSQLRERKAQSYNDVISPWMHHIDRDHTQGREIASKMRKDFSLHGGNIDYVLMHIHLYVCVERQRKKEKVGDQ